MKYENEILLKYDSFPLYRFKLHLYKNKKKQYKINLIAYSYDNLKQEIYNKTKNINEIIIKNIINKILNINFYELNINIEKELMFIDNHTFELIINNLNINILIKGIPKTCIIFDIFMELYKYFDIKIEYI